MKTNLNVFLCLILLIAFSVESNAQDSIKKKRHFELSFGQSVLFISGKKLQNVYNEAAITVPKSSLLFFAKFRPDKKIRIPVFFNLPTESRQYLVNQRCESSNLLKGFSKDLFLKEK